MTVGDTSADHTILGRQEPKERILGGRAGNMAMQLEDDCGSYVETPRGQQTYWVVPGRLTKDETAPP